MGTHVWLFYAIGAALTWGVSYAMAGRALNNGLPISWYATMEALVALPIFLLFALKRDTIAQGLKVVKDNPSTLTLGILAAVTFVIGTYFILFSISLKNATLASMIEISYPLFTCFFAWLFFRDMHLNYGTAFGALLIFAGIGVIYWKSGY